MSFTMANTAGRFVWHDLMTTDPDAAMKFYDEIAGWGTMPFEGSSRPYTMWTNNGVPLGGVTQLTDEMKGVPPSWMASVGVDNVDDSVAKANELGGRTVMPAADIPGAGRYAVISDPQGVPIAIFQPSGEMTGPGGQPGNGEFSWHELSTSDSKAAFDFYSKLFGWESTGDFDMGEMGLYQMYGQGGVPYGGMMTRTAEMPPPAWLCYIHVPDAKESAKKIESAGGKVMMGPMEVPGGDWVAIGTDPQGAPFAVHSSKPE